MSDRSETICPTSGDICPALENLKTLYIGNADSVDHETASNDHNIYNIKRREYIAAATVRRCVGITEEGTCPTRDAMDVSKVRKGIVSVIRGMRAPRPTA